VVHYRHLADVSAAEALGRARGELAQMDRDQQVDEPLTLQDELARQDAPQQTLDVVGQEVTARRGGDLGREPSDFRHPRFWAPFVHLGIPQPLIDQYVRQTTTAWASSDDQDGRFHSYRRKS
jgi:CHAT domain-containing protein